MEEKYEEQLWGKVDFLHEKSKQEHNCLNMLLEIISKFNVIISDFSKSIDNIKNRKSKIIDDKDTTIYKLSHSFKQNLKFHIDEFKECSNHMKLTIIDPMSQTIEEKFTKEKDLFNQYNKIKNLYTNSKVALEKSRKEFESSAKLCEKNIFNLEQLKSYDFKSDADVAKLEERAKLSITNTKSLEDKYCQNLKEANKARENEISKQTQLLKHYQEIDIDFYSKINIMISFMVPLLKKMYGSLLKSLESIEEHCKKFNIKEDIQSFIKKNKSELKPDVPIQFIPYTPEASMEQTSQSGLDKKDIDTLDINYNTILILHNNFKDIRKDLDMEVEKKKYRLRFLCTKIFKIGPGVGFKPEEKSELLEFLNESSFKSYFLVILSRQRTKGRFQRSETLIHDLKEVLEHILEIAEKEKDFDSAKNCIILSQTFYHEKKGKKKKKVYLFDYIKNNKWLKDLKFWEGIIEQMIQDEIKKNDNINKRNNLVETEEQAKSRLSNIAFSQVLSYSNSMVEFMINKDDINKVVDTFVKKYGVEKEMAEAIYENIKNVPQIEEEDDDEEDTNNKEINKRPKAQSVYEKPKEKITDSRSKSFNEKLPSNSNTNIDNKKTEKDDDKNNNIDKSKIEDKKVEEKPTKEDKSEDIINKTQEKENIKENKEKNGNKEVKEKDEKEEKEKVEKNEDTKEEKNEEKKEDIIENKNEEKEKDKKEINEEKKEEIKEEENKNEEEKK